MSWQAVDALFRRWQQCKRFLDLTPFPILWPHFQLSARRGQWAMQLISTCSYRPDANRPRSQSKPQLV